MAGNGDERYPTTGGPHRHPIPDLPRIPRERWREVLIGTHPSVRRYAVRKARAMDLRSGAHADLIVAEIEREERAARARSAEAAAWPRSLPTPGVRADSRRRHSRQVNFRLSPPEYGELSRAAEQLGLRPSQAARMFVVRGVHQVLREAEQEPG